jgi:deazaflavin-dependent oxidoreductase (nitroreductase family)
MGLASRLPDPPPVPSPGSLPAKLWNGLTRAHVKAYRATGGRIGGRAMGAPVLLLDHVGRKSGSRRTTPLLYLEDGSDLVVVASRGGSAAPPAWWLNLEANPETTVHVGSERRPVVARTATPEEKRRLWPRLVEMYSSYDVYQRRTERDIPVVILSPR